MLKLREQQRKKQEQAAAAAAAAKANAGESNGTNGESSPSSRVSSAQALLQKHLTELELPKSTNIEFPDPKDFFNFKLVISPAGGYYSKGSFTFTVEVTQNFPFEPPKVKCNNKIYHPNIDLEGNVCLNILREEWRPVLSINSVVMGLNHLFLEPNPNDPLNKQAANTFVKDIDQFKRNVSISMSGGYVDRVYFDDVRFRR
ncbi:ubiquitin-conjugating enzyme/RWD-like protein [Scheffersomyces coipomensis]|uniref:ubiquitin-conjugating enzyme/RWD-like protein n=1 Tax=Scheffersomyces coipomensis TaxID=1788519 RepID=UPI00315D7078